MAPLSQTTLFLLMYLKLFSGEPLEVNDEGVGDQMFHSELIISPARVTGKENDHINFSISLQDFQQSEIPIKIFWETTGSYISPDEDLRNAVLNSGNNFNTTISISSSIIGVYSIKFFHIGEGNEKFYLNNGTETILVVERESVTLKNYFTITFSVLFAIALFFMGMDIDFNIVKKTLKRPIGPVVGIICQFLLMPIIAYGLGYIFLDTNFERLGLLFVGCSPGGSNSNLWTSMFGGDLNLSMTMTFISTICSFAMTTFWIYFLGTPLLNKHIQIPYVQLSMSLLSTVIPVLLGVFFKSKLPKKAEFVKKYISKPFFLIVLIIVPVFACITDSFFFYLCSWKHVVCGFLLGTLGYIFGAGLAKIFCQELPQVIAICFETAIQNVGIAYIAVNLAFKSPYSDMATIPMLSFVLLTTGPMVFIFYGIYFVATKIKGSRDGWKEVNIDDPSQERSNRVENELHEVDQNI